MATPYYYWFFSAIFCWSTKVVFIQNIISNLKYFFQKPDAQSPNSSKSKICQYRYLKKLASTFWVTFCVAFNKPCEQVKRAGLARLEMCPSQCGQSESGLRLHWLGDLSKANTLFKSKFRSILKFDTLLWCLILVSYTQVRSVILPRSYSKYMVGHIELVI